jgi:hypothetical protein
MAFKENGRHLGQVSAESHLEGLEERHGFVDPTMLIEEERSPLHCCLRSLPRPLTFLLRAENKAKNVIHNYIRLRRGCSNVCLNIPAPLSSVKNNVENVVKTPCFL